MQTSTPTLLIVDDELVIQKVIERALSTAGCHMLFAATCEEALATARSAESIEIVLLDKNLPDGSGLDIVKDLKTIQPDVEVLLITAYPSIESAVEAVAVGAVDYLEKPFESLDELRLRIQNSLDRVELKRQQKELLIQLRESNERYERAVQGSTDGIWDWDLTRNTIYFSARWKAMLGYARERFNDHFVDTMGDTSSEWFDRIHPEDLLEVTEAVDSHVSGRTSQLDVEYRIRHKDGEYRWMLCRGLVVRDSEGVARRLAGSQSDITERKTAEEARKRDAFRDPLTRLANSSLLEDRLEHAAERVARHKSGLFAILVLALDKFEAINDDLGRLGGDLLLVAVAQRLKLCMRSCDTLARVGPGEFAFVLEDLTTPEDLPPIVERIQQQFVNPFLLDDRQMSVTASIGAALGGALSASPEKLMSRAKAALRQAQSAGTGKYEVDFESMQSDHVPERNL